jgi:hypothetical protein
MTQFVETMAKQLETKGREINTYCKDHNIRIRAEDEARGDGPDAQAKTSGGGVLVANNP